MLDLTLNDFLKLKDVRFVNVDPKKFRVKHIKGISIDSRTIETDQIFWAIKGLNFDGHDFVSEAHSKSALCSVVSVDSPFAKQDSELPLVIVPDTIKALQELANVQRNKYKIPVIAITGSNGKTTVKEMIAHIMQTKVNIHKTKGNQNNQIGCPLTMLLLSELHDAAVLELGTNQFGEIEILTEMVEPSHALITMISDTHLEFLKSRRGVAKEKLSLFDGLKEGSIVFKNLDEPFISKYNREKLRYVTYSFDKDADVKGSFGALDENGCGTLIVNERFEIKLQVPGLHNVRNALAAVTVVMDMGFTDQEIKEALETYSGFEKRMQFVKWNGVTIINDSYNANPTSMKLAIDTLLKIKHSGKIVLALGDMNELGEKSDQMHREILDYGLSNGIESIFLVGLKMHEAWSGLEKSKQQKITVCRDLNDLATRLSKVLKDGDIMLLKGSRSMQMEKVMAYLP